MGEGGQVFDVLIVSVLCFRGGAALKPGLAGLRAARRRCVGQWAEGARTLIKLSAATEAPPGCLVAGWRLTNSCTDTIHVEVNFSIMIFFFLFLQYKK